MLVVNKAVIRVTLSGKCYHGLWCHENTGHRSTNALVKHIFTSQGPMRCATVSLADRLRKPFEVGGAEL